MTNGPTIGLALGGGIARGKVDVSVGRTGATSSQVAVEADLPLAKAFELEAYDGRMVRLEDYRGKVVLIDFWSEY